MATIELSSNRRSLVDDKDLAWLSAWKWSFDGRYVHRMDKNKKIYMHRLIMGNPTLFQIDHINRNKLDNRRVNLRLCTSHENNINKSLQKNNKSGVKGVYWSNTYSKWHARIKIYGKSIHLGLFRNLIDAKKARDEAEKTYFNIGGYP